MKTVFASATGQYRQGNLTRELFRDLVESYDPNVYEAGAYVAHTSEWNRAGITEPPRLAAVKSLSDNFIDHSGRVYLSIDLDETAEYEEAQRYFPHKSIEYWPADDPRNPLNQEHVAETKKGKPYLRGFALLGDSPAAKLPHRIMKFFGRLTDETARTLARYSDTAHGLYAYQDDNTTRINMKNIATALGLGENATEEQIVDTIEKLKKAAPQKPEKEYRQEIAELKATIETLEEGKEEGVKEYADKLATAQTRLTGLRTRNHELVVAGLLRDVQAKNTTVPADKLERLKMFADRDYRDGDDEYTLAKSYAAEIPENKPEGVGKVAGRNSTAAAKCPDKREIKTYAQFLDLPGKKAALFRDTYPEYVEELREEFA